MKSAFLPSFLLFVLAIAVLTQPGCGGSPAPDTSAPAEHQAPGNKTHSSGGSVAKWIAPPPMDLPKDVLQTLESNIKAWVAKKGHSITRDKTGKVIIKTAKGRKSKVSANVFPPNDKLPKAVIDQMETRIKEWAATKGHTTARNKKGRLIGKNAKGNNVNPPFELFLSSLPDDLAPVGAPAGSGSGSGKGSTASDTEEDADEDPDPGE